MEGNSRNSQILRKSYKLIAYGYSQRVKNSYSLSNLRSHTVNELIITAVVISRVRVTIYMYMVPNNLFEQLCICTGVQKKPSKRLELEKYSDTSLRRLKSCHMLASTQPSDNS